MSAQSAEEKIRQTLARYCHLTDNGDYDGWVQLYTEDGCVKLLGSEIRGHAALREFIEFDSPPENRGLHMTTDSLITIAGDRADVVSNFLFVAGGENAGVVVAAGRYIDVMVPRGDQWLFLEREAVLLLPVASQPWGGRVATKETA